MPPARDPKGQPQRRGGLANQLAGVHGSGKARVGVRPVKKAAPPLAFLKPASRAVAQRDATAKRQSQARGGKDDKSSADLHRGDHYKKSDEYARSLALAALQQTRKNPPKFKDISVSKDHKTVTITHRRKFQLDPTETYDTKALLSGRGEKPAGFTARQVQQSGVQAASLKILNQTTRPLHGIAGAADALVQGKSLSSAHHALTRGLQNKDQKLFSDVLKHAGAGGLVQSVGGFALDVGLDPTTYVSGGTAAVGRKAALKTGTKAVKAAATGAEHASARAVADSLRKSAGKGIDAKIAKELADHAGKEAKDAHLALAADRGARATSRAAAASTKGRGVDVRFAGRSMPGVTSATAAVGRGAKKAGSHAPAPIRKAGAVVKEQVREVRPSMAPAGADKVQFAAGRQVAREGRAATNAGVAAADREARGLAHRIDKLQKDHGPQVSAKIIDAIEKGRIGDLPAPLRQVAREVRDHYRHMKRLRSRAGIREGTIANYFPHAREDALHARQGIMESDAAVVPGSRVKRTGPTPEGSSKRTDKRRISEINPERIARGESPHSTDIPLVTLNYAASTARAVAENTAFKHLADLGRTYKPGDLLHPGEAVFHLGYAGKNTKFGLRPVADQAAFDAAHRAGGKLVVLNEKTVETVLKRIKPAQATTQAGRAFDRVTGGFKRTATATIGFHVRNAVGDTQMAYLSQPGHRLPVNVSQAMKANRANVRLEKAQASSLGTTAKATGKTIKVGGQKMPVEDFVALAERHGVTNSGTIGRELQDLAAPGATRKVAGKARRKAGRAFSPVERAMRGRENVIRLSTFKHGLDRGMTPGAAADLSLKTHIDYGELTELERTFLRRALPFYTFSARAIPLHAEKLVTHPGKFANYQKVREEAARAAGLPAGYESNQDEYQQRQAGVPIKIGGKVRVLSAGLPIASSLNELPSGLPTPKNVVKYADELGSFAAQMANPLAKDPVELWANYSAFFRAPIRDPNRPLVSAPSWVTRLPDDAKEKLGVTTIIDKKTGKKVPAWDAKANYVSKAIPGPVALVQSLLTPGANRRGQGSAAKIVGALGFKVDDYDPAKVALDNAYNKAAELTSELGKMRQEGKAVGKDGYYTKSYQALLKQRAQVVKARDVLALQGGGKATAKGKQRPLTAQEKIHKEISDYRKQSDPAEAKKQVLDEIRKYKAAGGQ